MTMSNIIMRESLVHLMIDGLIGKDNLKNEFYTPIKLKRRAQEFILAKEKLGIVLYLNIL